MTTVTHEFKMILKEEQEQIDTFGLKSESEFTIKASAKAFDILSSKLYKDPIRAIVREIGCNAYDAHVDAGIAEKPFVVKLPTSLDPVFFIRDFGPGLRPDQVEDVYTTYFESTKTDSNDFTGALGLGSKTPFSYGNKEFTVTSIVDGIEYVYLAFTQGGAPKLAPVSETKTEEPSGLKVQINVKDSDHYAFHRAVETVYRPFKTRPEIRGVNDRYQISGYGNTIAEGGIPGDGWKLVDKNLDLIIIQGNIEYPINEDQIFVKDTPAHNAYMQFINNQQPNLIITVPIGSLDFAASREELYYDEDTVSVIEKHIINVHDTFCKKFTDKVAHVTSLYDYTDFFTNEFKDQKLIRMLPSDFEFNGFKLDSYYSGYGGDQDNAKEIPKGIDKKINEIIMRTVNDDKLVVVGANSSCKGRLVTHRKEFKSRNAKADREYRVFTPLSNRNTQTPPIYVILDKPYKYSSRIREHLRVNYPHSWRTQKCR